MQISRDTKWVVKRTDTKAKRLEKFVIVLDKNVQWILLKRLSRARWEFDFRVYFDSAWYARQALWVLNHNRVTKKKILFDFSHWFSEGIDNFVVFFDGFFQGNVKAVPMMNWKLKGDGKEIDVVLMKHFFSHNVYNEMYDSTADGEKIQHQWTRNFSMPIRNFCVMFCNTKYPFKIHRLISVADSSQGHREEPSDVAMRLKNVARTNTVDKAEWWWSIFFNNPFEHYKLSCSTELITALAFNMLMCLP